MYTCTQNKVFIRSPVRLYVWEPFCIFRRLLYSWLVTRGKFYTKIFDFNASSNISKATLLWTFPQITQLSFDAEHNYFKEQHKTSRKQDCYVLSNLVPRVFQRTLEETKDSSRSFPDRWSKERRLWERDCVLSCSPALPVRWYAASAYSSGYTHKNTPSRARADNVHLLYIVYIISRQKIWFKLKSTCHLRNRSINLWRQNKFKNDTKNTFPL